MLLSQYVANHESTMGLKEKIFELKELLDGGLIDRTEHDARKARLLDEWQRPPSSLEMSPYTTTIPELFPGVELGPIEHRYRLVECLGGGGMGQVWLALDLAEGAKLGRDCHRAVKLVHPELLQRRPQAEEDLRREAMRVRNLRHPHIVAVYDWHRGDDGWALIVMEHLIGGTLRDLLKAEGNPGLPLSRVLELLRPLVNGLDYAHTRRIIHRDIKPDNVMLDEDGIVKLVDFGLAFQLRRTASFSGLTEALPAGTPEYLAPEVARSIVEPSPQHDVYSLACLIWELLVGTPPFSPEMAYQRGEQYQPSQGQMSSLLQQFPLKVFTVE